MNFFKKLFGGNSNENENYNDENYDEFSQDDEPFIKPYDFFIEADERRNAEIIFGSRSPQNVDILQKLEEMELSFDIINDLGIKRKLKKLYSELAFEIDEYVSYAGGRSVNSFDTEEVDDINYGIYVDISKKDDDSPFEIKLKICADQE